MNYRLTINRQMRIHSGYQKRTQNGSVTPLIVLSITVIIAFIAFAVDVMRTVHATEAVQFASEAAGVYAYQSMYSGDGQKKPGSPEDNALGSLQQAAGASGIPWNLAPAGPNNGVAQTPVTFDASDVTVNPNGSDSNDFYLQVRARRAGDDALKMYFMPAIFAFSSWSGSAPPPDVNKATPFRTSEIITQPATRVGAGPSRGASSSEPGAGFAGFATFPIGISNNQFRTLAQSASAGTAVTIDIVNSTKPSTTASNRPNHINGSFINLYGTNGLNYYGDGAGSLALSQLNSTMQYFAGAPSGAVLAPAVVERGSMVAAFDAGDATFKSNSASIATAASNGISPIRFHAVPVLSGDPKFGQRNQVIGFARLQLTKVIRDTVSGDITISAILGDSTPMANTTVGTGLASVPAINGNAIPAAVAPFLPRSFDANANSVGNRLVGIVMAPALSPRKIQGGPL